MTNEPIIDISSVDEELIKSTMSKTIESLFRECRYKEAKPPNNGHIIIATQEPVNYEKLKKQIAEMNGGE